MRSPRNLGTLVVRRLLGAGLTLAIASCTSPEVAPDSQAADEEWPILWQQSGMRCDFGRPARYLIREPDDLARFAVCDVPVDFRTQMVLIVFQGPTRSHDTGVRIDRVIAEKHALRPVIRPFLVANPDPGPAPATPYCVAVIPRDERNVSGFRIPGSIE